MIMSKSYYDEIEFIKVHNLIINRISVINQLCGVPFDGLCDSLLTLRYKDGTYSLFFFGVLAYDYVIYDLDMARRVFDGLCCLEYFVWLGAKNVYSYQRTVVNNY